MKNIKVKKIIYPLLSGVFFLAVVVVFIYSVKFLSSNIKNVFDTDDSASSHLTSLDMDNFYRVAKKLGLEQITDNRRQTTENAISIITTNETTSATSTETVATTTSESVIVATTTIVVAATTTAPIAPLPLDKSAIKISVLNGTKTTGLAGDLKNFLTAEGWTVANAGNAPAASQTVIKIKASKIDYSPLIRDSVSKKYALGADQTLNESDIYDIIVIIGK